MRSFSRGSSSWASFLLVLVAILGYWDHAIAANITWIGGNDDWSDNLDITNWSPNDEPDANDTAIFNTANTVNLGSNNTVNGLTMSGGIDLDTDGNDLTVDGLIQLTNASTNLIIDGNGSLVLADDVTINSGGSVRPEGGTLTVTDETGDGLMDINVGGTLSGHGEVNLSDTPLLVTSLINNDGVIQAFRAATILNPPPTGTLTINGSHANARINLDGGAEGGIVTVFRNQTLDINLPLADAFSGDMNLTHNATIDIAGPWTFDGGTIDVDNGFINNPIPTPDVPADKSFISGGALTQTGGTITVVDADGTLQFNAPFTATGGNLVNNGLVVFNANATIGAAANFTMPTNTSSITVGAGATVNIDDANFNADGNGTQSNVITVNSGSNLDIDWGAGAPDGFNGRINLNGGELDVTTVDNTWFISGTMGVGANTGTSQINGETVSIGAGLEIGENSTLAVNATSIWQQSAVQVGAGAQLRLGNTTFGLIENTFLGDGTLRIDGLLTVEGLATVETAIFDWDGGATGGVHSINLGTLRIDSPALDTDGAMDDSITIAGNATLEVNGPAQWEMRGELIANPAGAGTANITGTSRMVLVGGGANFEVRGNTSVGAPITLGLGSDAFVLAAGVLNLQGDAIYAGGDVLGVGVGGHFNPSNVLNTVVADMEITVDNFNFDRGDWIINSGAELVVDVDDYDNDSATNVFDAATITLEGGRIDITTDDAEFVMDGTLNMNGTTLGQITRWSGEALDIGDDVGTLTAHLNVTGPETVQISAPVDFNSDADVNIAAGGHLHIGSTVNFDTVNGANNAQFIGSGTLVLAGEVNVNEAATLNMPGGTVGLDDPAEFAIKTGNFINVDAPLVINAANLDSFGQANDVGVNTLVINNNTATGGLTVNLDAPGAAWTLNPEGRMDLTNDNSPATLLAGSDVNVNGTVDVTGDVRTLARVVIGSTGVINIQTPGEPFRLGNGFVFAIPNRIEGGTINGPGILAADSNRALVGFGTINADIGFDGLAELMADDGELNVNGQIIEVFRMGTADEDGILNVANPWNTGANIQNVTMLGGEIRGAPITNDGGITGRGLISARVINNDQIEAAGGTLVVETSANDNDWDGATGAGQLVAITGNLEIRDSGTFAFTGTVTATDGHEAFANGFEIQFEPGSTLNLSNGGVLKSNEGVAIEGNAIVAGSANSRIETDNDSSINFLSGSLTTVNGNLELDTNIAFARAGSSFTGPGSLIVLPGTEFSLADTGIVDVLLHNQGEVSIGGAGVGRADVRDYIQTSTGNFDVDLRGLALDQFDRLVVDGAAQLAGTLELGLGGGYVPSAGDTFSILSASAGLMGSFASVVQPSGMPSGLLFDVIYTPTLVQLTVVNAPIFSADFDLDGDVDSDDLDEWQTGYGVGALQTEGDADGDGDVDGRDFLIWQRQFGSNPANPVMDLGAVSVPEPASVVPMLMALGLLIAAPKRSHQ